MARYMDEVFYEKERKIEQLEEQLEAARTAIEGYKSLAAQYRNEAYRTYGYSFPEKVSAIDDKISALAQISAERTGPSDTEREELEQLIDDKLGAKAGYLLYAQVAEAVLAAGYRMVAMSAEKSSNG